MSQPLMGKSQAALAPLAGRARARKRMFTSERGLGLAGLALAVASGSFAAYIAAQEQQVDELTHVIHPVFVLRDSEAPREDHAL